MTKFRLHPFPIALLTFLSGCVGSIPFAAAQAGKQAATDRDRLIGSWYETSLTQQGETTKFGTTKLIITEKTTSIIGTPEEWKLDPKANPKQLDIGFHPGIYRFEGDKLILCLSSVGSVDAKRPTKFEALAGQSVHLLEFQRCEPIPGSAPEKKFDPQLKQTIVEAIKLLEEKRDEELLKHLISPQEFEGIPAEMRPVMAKRLAAKRSEFLNMMRVLLKVDPKIREVGPKTIAVFDLTRVLVPGETSYPGGPVFQRIEGKWYTSNDPNPPRE
ncbi:MAG: hypothetical protein JWM11_5364 [Planctomycetaceae bacterium]|nr:hypothetical protein [Planctomycetaceae bacterium]